MEFDVMKQKTAEMSSALQKSKDEHIIRAINEFLGTNDWKISDLSKRGNFKIYPDKTEIFELDGVDLLQFSPIEYVADGFKITSTFSCTKLYQK